MTNGVLGREREVLIVENKVKWSIYLNSYTAIQLCSYAAMQLYSYTAIQLISHLDHKLTSRHCATKR